MKEIINFKINDNTNLKLIIPCERKALHCCTKIQIFLETREEEFLLCSSDVSWALESFKDLLEESMGSCEINKSINNNIGFLWNEWLQEKVNNFFEIITLDGVNRWVGEHYLLWESRSKLATWLYYKNGFICLEITPVYKWHYTQPERGEIFIPYNEWIKSYKPIIAIKIDKEIAKDLLVQAKSILQEIGSNDAKYLHQEEKPSVE